MSQRASWVADVLDDPEALRRLALGLLPVLLVLGLLLPPASLGTRIATIGYAHVSRDGSRSAPADVAGVALTFDPSDLPRAAHVRLRSADLPRALADVPAGHEVVGDSFRLDVYGDPPRGAWLTMPLSVPPTEQPFVDPYGWDGRRWRWMPPSFPAPGQVRVRLPLDRFVPRWVIVTRATEQSTELSVVLLPPPAVVPAAVAEVDIVELRGYHLHSDDGSLSGTAYPVPVREGARRLAVVDNVEDGRLRTDLLANMLIRPETRRRHRQALADLVRRDELDGVVLDYRGVPPDLQPAYVDLVRRLSDDLRARGLEVVVALPASAVGGSGAYDWDALADAADGLRIVLPDEAPVSVDALDGLVQAALRRVERRHLQLSVPAHGRDVVEGEARPIGFGAALDLVLDMARSDAPERVSPGQSVTIELPTLRESGLGRDPSTGMWRFDYWDANRRKHMVWLNDAAGLRPAFEIASRYRLGRLALDRVEGGVDPGLWALATGLDAGEAVAVAPTDYRLRWRLLDDRGRVVAEATSPLGQSSFTFDAPDHSGTFHLGVDLVAADGRPAVIGRSATVRVAPAPPPTPRPTAATLLVVPTPIPYLTAAAPPDEARLQRTPVRVDRPVATTTGTPRAADARVTSASAVQREGPGIEHRAVSDLKAGDELEVLGRTQDGRWLLVRTVKTGIEGWVLSDLVTLRDGTTPATVVSTPEPTPRR